MIRRKRKIKAYDELNPIKVKPPAFLEWARRFNSGAATPWNAVQFGATGEALSFADKLPLASKIVPYGHLPKLSPAFVPLTPIYTELAQLGPRTGQAQRTKEAMVQASRNAKVHGVLQPALFFLPVYDQVRGFVLILSSGRVSTATDAGFRISLPDGTLQPVPHYNMLGVIDYSDHVSANWIIADVHSAHGRIDLLIKKYTSEFGQPDLYAEISALVKEKRRLAKEDGSK